MCAVVLALYAATSAAAAARPVTWGDLPASVHSLLERFAVTASGFDARIAGIDREARARVQEGDFDHLVFYVLQSRHFTRLPPIEPALSAREFTNASLGARPKIPASADARMSAFLTAVESRDRDPRLSYFRALLRASGWDDRRKRLTLEYARAMTFLYQKEFVARAPEAVERLYQERGLSTDTAVEAGYAVHAGLGVLRGLEPSRRIRRVLIVGPGIDLAPRTGMLEMSPPESYQPWAVIDALVALGLSRLDDLEVVGADINPRVVDRLRASRQTPPVLQLVTGIGESPTLTFSKEYREYFTALGRSLGPVGPGTDAPAGHLIKTVRVDHKAADAVRGEPLNIVTERFTGEPFDLAIATNILPYFNDAELMLAVSNIAGMLAPGGVLLHNELRPVMQEYAAAAGLPGEQSRQVVIASVKGAPPLADTIFLHRRR